MSSPFESTTSIFCRSFSAKRDKLADILNSADHWCVKKKLDPVIRKKVKAILDEVLANIYEHTGLADSGQSCILSLSRSEDFVTMDIEDSGPPFNPLRTPLPDPASVPLEERHPGGLGLLLVRKLADMIDYRYEEDRNILSIRFRIQPE